MNTPDARSEGRPASSSPSGRATVIRHPERARYDRATIDAVLREGLVCHVEHVEHVAPGRGAFIRPPSRAELDVTRVVWFAVDEVSAKVRAGPPIDAVSDLDLPV